VRSHPLTLLHDHASGPHEHDWHQLTFALRGHIEIETAEARWAVPADRALWIPARVPHRESTRAHVSMRMLYLAPGAVRMRSDRCRAIVVGPLLRELIAHICALGALDRRRAEQHRLIGVLVDQLATAEDVSLDLPLPRDGRACRLAALIDADPSGSLARLAGRAGASLRTLERLFLAETGVPVGEWRRRRRLFHALGLLEAGAAVGDAADAAGYATISAFTAAFKRQFGVPPSRRRGARTQLPLSGGRWPRGAARRRG
jgi:AraC-like DNA-binding protein